MVRDRLLLPVFGLMLAGWFSFSSEKSTYDASALLPQAEQKVITPSGMSPVRRGTAQVRFVNAMPGSPALEFGEDSSMIVSNVVYGAVSPYAWRRSGQRLFSLRHQAATTHDAIVTSSLLDGERYTVLAMCDSVGRPMLHVVLDELQPDPGRARVRVINAAAAPEEIVVKLRGGEEPFLSAVQGTSVAAVRDVFPMTTGFSLRDRGDHSLATVNAFALSKGTSYTIVITSRPKSPVSTIAIVDRAGELRDRAILARE